MVNEHTYVYEVLGDTVMKYRILRWEGTTFHTAYFSGEASDNFTFTEEDALKACYAEDLRGLAQAEEDLRRALENFSTWTQCVAPTFEVFKSRILKVKDRQ